MPECSNDGRLPTSLVLKSMNQATAASGDIAASLATSSGGPPKPARSSRCRARSGVQSEGPIDDRSRSQPSVISFLSRSDAKCREGCLDDANATIRLEMKNDGFYVGLI